MYGLDLLALALTLQSPILYAPLCKRQVQVVMDFWSSHIDSHDTQGNGYSNLLAAGLTDALAVLIANWDMTVAQPSGETFPSILKLPYLASYSPLIENTGLHAVE